MNVTGCFAGVSALGSREAEIPGDRDTPVSRSEMTPGPPEGSGPQHRLRSGGPIPLWDQGGLGRESHSDHMFTY